MIEGKTCEIPAKLTKVIIKQSGKIFFPFILFVLFYYFKK